MLSLPLALEDFVPVVLTAGGLWFVVSLVGRADRSAGRWAAIGAILIVAGGLSRAIWKTVVATGGADVAALFAVLYLLLATGYLVLAVVVWRGRQAHTGRPGRSAGDPRLRVWMPAAIVLAILLPVTAILAPSGGRLLPILWLFAATIGSITTSLLLARWARDLGRPGIGWLFIVSLTVTLVLNGLARASDQSEALQWVEQLVNTLNQGIFLIAALRLERAAAAAAAAAAPMPAAH